MVGADNWGLEVGPTEDKEEAGPVHQMLIPQNGIHSLENLVTEALAKDKAYEFMFVLTKSKTKGSTGANIAPVHGPGHPVRGPVVPPVCPELSRCRRTPAGTGR
jgi:hypothetical protein